jgi:hypothetical protein
MRSDAHDITRECLASKRFHSPSANDGQSQLEFSGFGVESLAAHKAQVTRVPWASLCSARTTKELTELVAATGTRLLDLHGIGSMHAAKGATAQDL